MSDNGGALDVAVVYSIPSPYQEQLFQRVAATPGVNLHVYYCGEINEDRDWEVEYGDYDYSILPGTRVMGNGRLNPSIVQVLWQNQPDVVVIGGYAYPTMQLAAVTSWTLNIPLVLWNESHGRDWRNQNPDLRTRIKDVLLAGLVKGCDAFLVPGRLQCRYLEAHGASPDDIFLGTHTCDVTAFREAAGRVDPEMTREEYGITEDVVLTFVGRLIEEKGLTELVDAASAVSAEHDDVGFVIAGSGPLEDELRERCRQLGLDNVYLPGFVPRRELPALYGASDVFVFPSRGDPWGVVVNEAMACGLPVVTTSAVGSGYDLVIDGVNGAIVEPNDSEALADGIEQVINATPHRLGNRSAQIIERWMPTEAAEAVVTAVKQSVGYRDFGRAM